MNENEIAKEIVDVAYKIHTRLGPGLFENVYETIMEHALKQREMKVERQVPVRIVFEGMEFKEAFRADLIVEDKVIIELKSVETNAPIHKKQLTTYLKLADQRLGLLINFGHDTIKEGITRIVNGLEE